MSAPPLPPSVRHELNNELQIIAGALQLLRMRGAADPGTAGRVLDSAAQSVARAATLVRHAGAGAGHGSGHEVRAAARLAARLFAPHWPVRLRDTAQSGAVLLPPGELEHAVLALLLTVRDGTAPGTVLRVHCTDVPSPATGPGRWPHGHLQVTVCAAGDLPGPLSTGSLEPALRPVLAGAQQAHGMLLRREGSAGPHLQLLLGRLAAPLADPAPAAPAPSALAGLRVLCVDDDPAVGEMTATMLGGLGAQVSRAASADEVLGQALDAIDLVVSDVLMPGRLDGLGLAGWLAAHHPALPVLLVSGYVAAPERLGQFDRPLLRKPFGVPELLDAVARTLREH